MSIKYFALSDLRFTPFGKHEDADNFKNYSAWTDYINKNNIYQTDNENEADLYICQKFPINNKKDLLFWRLKHRFIPVLLWTHEPRFNNFTQNFFPKKIYIPEIHVMNVFTNDVYLNHFSWFGNCIYKKLDFVTENHFYSREKMICTLGSYRPKFDYWINGKNIDLCEFRQKIALEGYNRNIVDICGRWWPNNVKVVFEDRNSQNWHESKINFIKKYKFNICLENTNYGYYITEKLWDSISAKCLPIYFGTDIIYQIFKKNSFVDVNDFNSINDLFDYIENMSAKDYTNRLNSCIETYNHAFETIDYLKEEFKAIDKAIEKIRKIVGKS